MKKTVIVDDSDEQRLKLKLLLEQHSLPVIEAASGEEGYEKIKNSENLGLFIFDYNMPGINGLDLVEKIRNHEEYDGIPIFMLSSENDPQLMARGKKMGATWLIKPMNPTGLIKAIKSSVM
ncbi:MAG: response regulator [Oligoflexales bacterium]